MILVRVHDGDHPVAHRIETFPCTIGRSMRCAIRLDDASVSALHAEVVEADGAYLLRDLGSTNGVTHAGAKVRELRLAMNETVHLGNLRLEFQVDEALPKTRLSELPPDVPEGSARGTAAKVAVSLAVGFAVLCAASAADVARTTWPPDRPAELLGTSLALWLALVGVAFLLSLFCKLNAKRFHFHRILGHLVFAYVAGKAVATLGPTVIFNLHNVAAASFLPHVGYAAIAFWFFYSLQKFAIRRWPTRSRALVAAGAALVAALLVEVVSQRRGGAGDRERMTDLGLPVRNPAAISRTSEDLVFDVALSIAESDGRRIKALEELEAERESE